MKSILVDMKTGDIYSEKQGWNTREATITRDWPTLIYHKTGPLGREKEQWKDRELRCIPFCMPQEPEIYT